MSKLWQRLWCAHCWLSVGIVDVIYGKGYVTEYECHKCGKHKRFTDIPISYISDHAPHKDVLL